MMFVDKGKRGYLKSKKKKYILIMLGLVLLIIGFVALGVYLNGDRKNIYTIMAVLTVLPFANILTVFIALFPYKEPDKTEYASVASDNNICFLTELAVTSPKFKTVYFRYVYINEDNIYAYTTELKNNKNDYEEYITGMLASAGHQVKMNIYTEMNAFKRIARQNSERRESSGMEKKISASFLSLAM